MHFRTRPAQARRRGVILLVVLALLTLFAAVGLSFVIYSQSVADASRIFRESETQNPGQTIPDDLPETLLAQFLAASIFGSMDEGSGLYSAGRGSELARGIYGTNYTINADGTYTMLSNSVPYCGTGRLHYTSALSQDDYYLVNYQYWSTDGFLRDPERYGTRTGPRASGAADNRGTYLGGLNAPYTYADLNTIFLAAVRADGTVMMPSYFRTNTGFGALDPTNTNWNDTTKPELKYLVLRPRPADNQVTGKTAFPTPADKGGDVQNLPGGTGYNGGKNDSIWMDWGFGVKTLADGRKYKPMIASLWVGLDSRINLNIHGNIRAQNSGQGGGQGWGPWEVNPRQLVDPTNDPQAAKKLSEWANVFIGANTSTGQVVGRYGKDNQPGFNSGVAQPGTTGATPHFYGKVDYDGVNETAGYAATGTIALPAAGAFSSGWPTYPAAGYGNGSNAERTNHPLLFSFWQPHYNTTPGDDERVYDISNMKALLRDGSVPIDPLSDLAKLLPTNLNDQTYDTKGRLRRLVTTISFDVDQPGVVPWVWDPASSNYAYQIASGATYPTGGLIDYPLDSNYQPAAITVGTAPPTGSEFGTDWRAASASTGRLDVNNKPDGSALPDYPVPDATTHFIDLSAGTNLTDFNNAQTARQDMAKSIFLRLVKVTGAFDLVNSSATPTQAQVDALRYLAQLSANMVDYIDSDDYMTPFYWVGAGSTGFQTAVSNTSWALDPIGKGWVFGTELARLSLNEAYAEIANDPNDTFPKNPMTMKQEASKPFYVNFWVELHNPFNTDSSLNDSGSARLQVSGSNRYPGYVLCICKTSAAHATADSYFRQANNVLGNPNPANLADSSGPLASTLFVTNFKWDSNGGLSPTSGVDTDIVRPSDGQFAGTKGDNKGFYVLAPGSVKGSGTTYTNTAFPDVKTSGYPEVFNTDPNVATLRVENQTAATTTTGYPSSMYYSLPNTTSLATLPTHSIVLRRLACPSLPPNYSPDTNAKDPTIGTYDSSKPYNPYITVDYIDSIKTYDGVQFLTSGPNDGVTDAASKLDDATAGARQAWGRKQPYAAEPTRLTGQPNLQTTQSQPGNTFFQHNGVSQASPGSTLTTPFDWLVHLDRQLSSPMELLMVSGYKPSELLHTFVDSSGNAQKHLAPWYDQSSRLYRVFEFLETKNRATGMAVGGRQPGKININDIWDVETFLALCDPQVSGTANTSLTQASNNYNRTDVINAYNALMSLRSPGTDGSGNHVPGNAADRPFLPLGMGAYPAADSQFKCGSGVTDNVGINDTFLRANANGGTATTARLLQVTSGSSHPYVQNQLMAKIFNHVTTRSNVFAVWLTVGFFDVNDDTVQPVKLGDELGKSQAQNIRHHMFAIVDRSALTVLPEQVAPPFTTSQTAVTAPGTATISPAGASVDATATLPTLTGTSANGNWTIKAGTILTVDAAGTSRETLQVTSVDTTAKTFTAKFNKTHAGPQGTNPGFTIYVPGAGNPGPNPSFNMRDNSAVVPYYLVID